MIAPTRPPATAPAAAPSTPASTISPLLASEQVQATLPALRRVNEHPDIPVETLFTRHAPTPQVLRIAVKDSTVGGLLPKPARAGRTVFLFKIGQAAAQTGDLRFTFGTGGPERLCVFQDFFLSFMSDLQVALRERRGMAPAPTSPSTLAPPSRSPSA